MIKDQNPKIQMLPVGDIDVDADNRLRPASEAGVEALVTTITELGIIKDAIHVRRVGRGDTAKLVLIAGGHRLAAAKRLEWDEIPARVWADITDNDARFMEIDDNLAGKSLDPLDQAEFIAARKAVYEAEHPEAKRGNAGAQARWDASANLAVASFVAVTAEATGLSERNIQRRAMIGEKLTKRQIAALRSAPQKIKGGELEALAKMKDDEDRNEVITLFVSGNAKSIGDAWATVSGGQSTKPDAPLMSALRKAWTRASAEDKVEFIRLHGTDITELMGA